MRKSTVTRTAVIVGCAVLLLAGAAAATSTEGMTVRMLGSSVNPTQDLTVTDSETLGLGDGTTLTAEMRGKVDPDNAFGFCIDFERRVNDLVGVNLSVMRSGHRVDFDATETARITDDATGITLFEATETVTARSDRGNVTPFLVGPNFHLTPNRKADLYAGPFLGYVLYDDIVLQDERIGIKDDFAYGATVGLDVPFGSEKLAFSGAARYLISEADPSDPDTETLDMDSLVVQFGLSYRF